MRPVVTSQERNQLVQNVNGLPPGWGIYNFYKHYMHYY